MRRCERRRIRSVGERNDGLARRRPRLAADDKPRVRRIDPRQRSVGDRIPVIL